MNQKTLLEILQSREDLSDYVFHFTKGRNAKDTLVKILCNGSIKDINKKGYICFSETPITMLPSMFQLFKRYDDPLYAPYGIGIRRNKLYDAGGRPVIYGVHEERALLPPELQWRFVPLYPDCYDFSWLREWRIPVAEFRLTYNNCFVVVDTEKDCNSMEELLLKLDDVDIDAQPEDGGIHTEYIGYFSRNYKVVAMEEIEKTNRIEKKQFENILNEQDNQFGRLLGSTWE